MKTLKKALSVFLVIIMVSAFAPAAFAAPLPGFYYIWIGDVQVSEFNKNDVLGDGGSVKFNPETWTLTLTDAEIKADGLRNAGITIGNTFDTASPVEKINIEIVGDSYVYGSKSSKTSNICSAIYCYCCKEVNFCGDGTLTLTGYENEKYTAAGIYGNTTTKVNVESGKVTVIGKNFKYYKFTDDCKVREKDDRFVVTHITPLEAFFRDFFSAISRFFVGIGNFFKNLSN